ncbi:colicin immunity domain-containing protein [Campylobacter concisus]|uniref:colicin immunity domain-containing protein n=1 Tax=Campylobacter concisus TaxID=199 RepID=UPI0015E16CD7|nr:colicin immunity domain-containing protein [Campylobacter concisus]
MLLDAINRSSFVVYNNFLTLLKDFANDKIDASTYQTEFFKLLQKDDGFFNKYYDVMQSLFYDVEEYCPIKELRNTDEIDEITLKNSTINALDQITL